MSLMMCCKFPWYGAYVITPNGSALVSTDECVISVVRAMQDQLPVD